VSIKADKPLHEARVTLSLICVTICTHTLALHMRTHIGWHMSKSRFEVEAPSLNLLEPESQAS
jgi:hypothetical protein